MSIFEVIKSSAPTEVRPFKGHGSVSIYDLGSEVIGRGTFEPGWRWSQDLKPIAGTEHCQVQHCLYVVSGRMAVVSADGSEKIEVSAGDFVRIDPGHDAWVVGDEACVAIDFTGMRHYAQPSAKRPDAATESMTAH